MNNTYYIYFLSNNTNSVLYIGVSNNLQRRLYEHKNGFVEGFTKRYHTHRLIYFEQTNSIEVAIRREKQLKGWARKRKNQLVEQVNPKWSDLSLHW